MIMYRTFSRYFLIFIASYWNHNAMVWYLENVLDMIIVATLWARHCLFGTDICMVSERLAVSDANMTMITSAD